MKHLSKFLVLSAGVLVLTISSCKKVNVVNNDENQITDEIAKVETIWDGISEKNDNDRSTPKMESRASDKSIKDAIAAVNQKYQNYLRNLGNGSGSILRVGNLVGVIKNETNCNGYDEIEITMDCEDHDPQTQWWDAGVNYRPNWTIGNNAALRFCIVPGNDFHAFSYTDANGNVSNFRYAVLRVTSNFYPDAFEANRYIDNEDNRNRNTAWYLPWSGQGYSVRYSADQTSSIYRTFIDGNSLLSFHVFDASRLSSTTFTQWPDFNGMSYGVFANSVPVVNTSDPDPMSFSNRGALITDDEDGNNQNTFTVDEDVSQWYPDPNSSSFQYYNPLQDIITNTGIGTSNTYFELQKVR